MKNAVSDTKYVIDCEKLKNSDFALDKTEMLKCDGQIKILE